jgi:hypothetical protein
MPLHTPCPPPAPPLPRTNRTSLIPPLVLTGRAASPPHSTVRRASALIAEQLGDEDLAYSALVRPAAGPTDATNTPPPYCCPYPCPYCTLPLSCDFLIALFSSQPSPAPHRLPSPAAAAADARARAGGGDRGARRGGGDGRGRPARRGRAPPPLVLSGHAASLTPY